MIALRLFSCLASSCVAFLVACLVLLLCSTLPVFAQEADTTIAPPPRDSLAMPPADSLNQPSPPQQTIIFKTPVPFLDLDTGITVGDSLPTISAALGPADLLAGYAGSFLYDFGASGWPDGWSPYGIAPHDVALSYNGIPFDNSVTGIANYELLPFALLQPFRLQPGRFGAPLTVNTRLRSLNESRPITEIRYRQSNNGLKSVLVFHSQRRSIPLRQRSGILGILLAYGGHGANGEYPGSRLEGARQLLTRLRYQHPWGSVELMNLSNRRRLGAHAGVVVNENNYEAIYARFGASVINASAQRQSLRNDLALTIRTNVLPDTTRPFTTMGYWTAGTFRYVDGDTLQARSSRFGYQLSQALKVGKGEVNVTLEGWREHLRKNSTALPDSLDPARSALQLTLHTTLPLGPAQLDISPTLYSSKNDRLDDTFLGGSSRLSFSGGMLGGFLQAAYTTQNGSWIEEYGWEGSIQPFRATSRMAQLQAGISFATGPLTLEGKISTNNTENYTDFFARSDADSIDIQLFSTDVNWVSLSGELGLRKLARRGFYLTISPTLYTLQNANSSSAHSTLGASLPELYLQGRLGMRYVIFRGDLDLDLYTKARLWSDFDSRTLHAETGVLVLRPIGSRPVDASVAMDVVIEAGIRTATLFLAFENVLSNPSLIVGNLLVPDYPLPAQRFRFGVYWPIQD
ncbi:MAG: hypothetical protein AAF564_06035 [Bacteroidota bacterium]